MGSGIYSDQRYKEISVSRGIDMSMRPEEVFASDMIVTNSISSFSNEAPRNFTEAPDYAKNIGIRECRESEEHPVTTPILIAFDVTGSMGRIPHNMIKEQFPVIMAYLIKAGVECPQICFMAVGDHYTDRHPIQVGQFEIDTEKLINGLQSLYLEGNGGGNGGESYGLAWIIAGNHTELDSVAKRGQKGFLFTIGDEPIHYDMESRYLQKHMKYESGCPDITAAGALEKAKEQYHVFHIHCTDGSNRFSPDSWNPLLNENVIQAHSTDIQEIIIEKVLQHSTPVKEESHISESVSGIDYSDLIGLNV